MDDVHRFLILLKTFTLDSALAGKAVDFTISGTIKVYEWRGLPLRSSCDRESRNLPTRLLIDVQFTFLH